MKEEKSRFFSDYVSTREAAERLGYTVQHTRLLIRQGRLEAIKFGRDWMIVRESVAAYKTDRTGKDERDGNAKG